jgi:hypothetical protein
MAEEVKVSVFMSEELRDTLAALAKADGRSLARFIEHHMKAIAAKAEKANG